jgi:hypothetical protein
MNIIVFSVNIGGYDEFKTPTIIDPNTRYILFTDNKYIKSKVWEIYHIDFIDKKLDNRKKARFIKLNPHLVLPHHDISIWIDHCYIPRFNNTQKMLNEIGFTNNEIMCYKHDVRNCIYKESDIVKNDKLDYHNIVNEQMDKYKLEGFPTNYGLFDSGFTIRKNNDSVIKFNETWWNEVKNHSGRDQLSQVYSSWKTSIKITPVQVGMNIYSNPYLNPKIKHPKKWSI